MQPDKMLPLLPIELAPYETRSAVVINYYPVTYPYPGCARFDASFGAVVIDIVNGLAYLFQSETAGVYATVLRKRIAADDFAHQMFAQEVSHHG